MAKTIERSREEVPDGEYAAENPLPSGIPFLGMVRETGAITAGVFPVRPPKQWFVNPRLGKLSGLEIGGDGRVFGHIASWSQSHIGMAGSVKAPKNRSGYAYYRTGLCETDGGEMVEVGQITLTGGHAPLTADVTNAVKHYDDTASAVMDVNIGEDAHGIWVAGALRPEVSDEQLRTLRASSVSGDWRPINGKLELVAVCAVNVPGFPIPRARVAGGATMSLVAAGTAELVEAVLFHDADSAEESMARLEGLSPEELEALAELDAQFAGQPIEQEELSVEGRLERLERQLLGEAADRRRRLDDAVLSAARSLTGGGRARERAAARREQRARVASLRARVAAGAPGADDARRAELRARVGLADAEPAEGEPAEGEPGAGSDSTDLAAELRRRVLGEVSAEAGESVDRAAELRQRVLGDSAEAEESETHTWDDGMSIELSTLDAVAAALRAQVSGGMTATATKAWDKEKRDKAANSGAAMKDGSYPIKDCADVGKAVKAIGRGKKSHASIKTHIKKRAKALGCTGKLPDDWK